MASPGRLALLLVAALPAAAWAGDDRAPASDVRRSPEALRVALEACEARLVRFVARAHEDPRIARIERYMGMREPPRPGARRETTVRDLLALLSGGDVPLAVREKARDGLSDANCRTYDPDLDTRRGRRAALSREELVPLLVSKDETSRRLSADVLNALWTPPSDAVAIHRYDAKDASTWKAARVEWLKLLRSR
jgi:hypothetical protein